MFVFKRLIVFAFKWLIRIGLSIVISLVLWVYSSNQLWVKFYIEKLALIEAKLVDRFIPDALLRFLANILDRILRPQIISTLIYKIEKFIPLEARSAVIEFADQFSLDAVASSRKASTIVAYIAKYIPDSVVPPEAAEGWSNLKLKLHIPTLISRNPDVLARQN